MEIFSGTSEPPSGWNPAEFLDSSWSAEPGGFGFEDGDDSTLIDPVNSLYPRTSFHVDDTSSMTDDEIHADQGIYIYEVRLNREKFKTGKLIKY